MIKFIFLILCVFSFLNASLIKKVETFETSDKTLFISDIKNSKNFKETKLPIIRHSENTFFVKLTLDKQKLKNKVYSLELENSFNPITLEENFEYIDIYKDKVIELSSFDFKETIFIKINNEEDYINFNVNIFESKEYMAKQILISKLYGLSYGIIFAAFLYYFALFLFNRDKTYIYYSLTQLTILCTLLFLSYKEIQNDRMIIDVLLFLFFVFSNLFTKNFLNTKKNVPKIDKVLSLLIVIYALDFLSGWIFDIYFLSDNLPKSSLLIVYLIAGVIVYSKGYKPALFYVLAWAITIVSFLFVEMPIYFQDTIIFIKPNYILHLAIPLESLILAFALSYKMKMLEEEKQQQQEFLTHQSKLASMGEMIGNIAHQWRQPLTHLSYIMMNLKTAYKKDKLSEDYFQKKSDEARIQLEFMSQTINDFRDFFKPSKEKETFSLVECISEVINLLDMSFKHYNIEVEFKYEKDVSIFNLKGELSQVIFNILNNAKDEFIKREIENPKININFSSRKDIIHLSFLDNAKGIDENIIDKIFEPYFTTKDKGLGIGLYMSKLIIEKNIGGKLEVQNTTNGAEFLIKI